MKQRSVRNLLDQPLVTTSQVPMGDVTEVFVDPTEQRLIKLGIEWAMHDRIVHGSDLDLPFTQIVNFDPHQIVVSDEIGETAGLDLLNYDPDSLLKCADQLLDRTVRTESGEALGSLVDIFFDEEDGAILGYEITNDEIEAEHRRSMLMAPTTDFTLADGEVLVPDKPRLVELPSNAKFTAMEEELDQDYVFESDEPDRRSQNPELDEMNPDPNEYPVGHRVGFTMESPDSMFG